MKTVKVNKANLIKILKYNRKNHRSAFETALEGYRKECIRILEENLNALRDDSKHRVIFAERPPEDHTVDYDRVIKMAEMSVSTTLELDEHEFAQYVQDDWGWQSAWTLSNSKYIVAAMNAKARG